MADTILRDFLRNRRALFRITTRDTPVPQVVVPSGLPMLASLSRSALDLVGRVGRDGRWSWVGDEPLWDPSDAVTAIEALPHDARATPERVAPTLKVLDDLEDLKWSLLELIEAFNVVPTKITVLPPGDDSFDDEEGVVPASEILGRIQIDDDAFAIRKGFKSSAAVDLLWAEIAPGAAWDVRSPKVKLAKPKPQPKKPAATSPPVPSPARLAEIAEAAGRGRLRAARESRGCWGTISQPRRSDGALHLVAVAKSDRSVARRGIVYPATGASAEAVAGEVAAGFQRLFARVEEALAATSV